MKNLLQAGIHRVIRRKSRLITLAAIEVIAAVAMYFFFDGQNIFQVADSINYFTLIAGVFLGLVEFNTVMGDDIRAKSLQIAIGSGSKRRDVVTAQWLQIVMFTLLDIAILFVLMIICCALQGTGFHHEVVGDILIRFVFAWIRVCYASMFCIGLALWTQSTTISTLMFMAYGFTLVNMVADSVLGIGFLAKLSLSSYLPTILEGVVSSRLSIGIVSWPHLLGMVAYLVLYYFAACYIFQKKELEF